jgi:GDPmannose 4,6-dehydratase
MKSALITGITGQDGSYMAEYLLKRGYKVFGVVRRSSTLNFDRIKHIIDDVELINADLLDQSSLMLAMEKAMPDEVYNLAAQSFVPTSWDQPVLTGEFTALGVTRVLEAVRRVCPDAHFYQASSSEMFGKVQEVPQRETTPLYPRSPYGVAKVYGHWITVNYRESYNLFACSGILFNHESPRRGFEFVTRKITHTVAKIERGEAECLEIGNLEAKRDWGFAGDYVKAMHMMLNYQTPDDYVIATGETHTVREFCDIAFQTAGLDIEWAGKGFDEHGIDKKSGKLRVKVNKKYYRPAEVDLLIGNSEKAQKILGWNPEVSFKDLVSMMVENDMKEISSGNHQ